MCSGGLSGTSKSLITSAILFFTITSLQYVASLPRYANSLALRADCLSMFVDGVSYLGNLFAECNTNPRSKKQVELVVAGLSLTVLLGFTLVFFFDAANEVMNAKHNVQDDVDARIVLAFALLGLLFDSISIAAFFLWSEVPLFHPNSEDDKTEPHDTARDLNVLSALLHIWSDLLRSITTLIEALIILTKPRLASGKVDGVSALIVCSIIALTATGALFTWVKELQAHLQEEEAVQKYETLTQTECSEEAVKLTYV